MAQIFAAFAPIAAIIGKVAGVAGTALSAASAVGAGQQAKWNADVQAKALKTKGDQEFSASQKQAMDTRRKGNLIMSRARAVAAASGGAATDPTVDKTMENIGLASEESAAMDLYNGAVIRSDLRQQAALTKAAGKQARAAGWLEAAGTIYSDMAKRKREGFQEYESLYG